MKKFVAISTLMIASLSIATPALCAVKSATFQVSLTILESCRVDGKQGAPVVSCQMASSSLVAAAPAQSATAVDGAPAWVVTF
jgi:hypothetical protein